MYLIVCVCAFAWLRACVCVSAPPPWLLLGLHPLAHGTFWPLTSTFSFLDPLLPGQSKRKRQISSCHGVATQLHHKLQHHTLALSEIFPAQSTASCPRQSRMQCCKLPTPSGIILMAYVQSCSGHRIDVTFPAVNPYYINKLN